MSGYLGDDYWEPRTDREMAISLLAEGEHEHLDFKANVDLSTTEGKVKFVKDVVALANTHPGGHLLVGVQDDGSFPSERSEFDEKSFESANLRSIVSSYIDAPIHIRSQIHEIDGNEVVIIAVRPSEDMLPIAMTKQGDYSSKDNKQKSVFKDGEIFLREGSQNVRLRHAHWTSLLRRHDEMIREEARADISEILKVLAERLPQASDNSPLIPLSPDIPLESLPAVVQSHLISNNKAGLKLFIPQALSQLKESDGASLVAVSLTAIQALFGDHLELAEHIVSEMYKTYCELESEWQLRLKIITHVYIIGSAAVRTQHWEVLRSFVLKPYPINTTHWHYKSWIRHGQVEASRRELFPENNRGLMIGMARAAMANHQELRPDIAGEFPTDEIPDTDRALNSLCEFDFIQALLQQLPGGLEGDTGNPACAAYPQERVSNLLHQIVIDQDLRRSIAPDASEDKFQEAFKAVYELAKRQSHHFGHWWIRVPSTEIKEYIQ